MELRPKRCAHVGERIALIETGSRLLKGSAVVRECHLLTKDEQEKHAAVLQAASQMIRVHRSTQEIACISSSIIPEPDNKRQPHGQELNYEPNKVHAWTLEEVRKADKPVTVPKSVSQHAIVWVTLSRWIQQAHKPVEFPHPDNL